jgi:hypothetical protein
MKRNILYILLGLFLIGPIVSCSSSRGMCKSKKKYYKAQKCWNAKKQKYTRC